MVKRGRKGSNVSLDSVFLNIPGLKISNKRSNLSDGSLFLIQGFLSAVIILIGVYYSYLWWFVDQELSYFILGILSYIIGFVSAGYIFISILHRKKKEKEISKKLFSSKITFRKTAEKKTEHIKGKSFFILIARSVFMQKLDLLFFIVGIAIMIAGIALPLNILIYAGLCIMLFSLVILEIILHYKQYPTQYKKEMNIVNDMNNLLKLEGELKQKEHDIKRDIDRLYEKALHLAGMEVHAAKRESIMKKAKSHEEENKELKKMLLLADDLLEKLPAKDVERFLKTREFKKYMDILKEIKKEYGH